ncbi:organic cation transporter protein [Nephila pilipes]|uniref:Organic cation transporter protein n=1 Tax=Nephila pilipes TaxID=299642 RepID=A0A8X6SY91_NEPPI|nr:organic cation transporter protein [Nephila pilipes]
MTVSQKADENGEKEYTDIIGGNGWYQIGICIFCFFSAASHCLHDFTMTFFAPNMDHWCARPPEVLRANISLEEWKNLSLPLVESPKGDYEYSQCTMYTNFAQNGSFYPNTNASVIKCTSWEYDTSVYKDTMVDEWDLVCDREWMISMSKTVYMMAFLFSSSLSGQMSDRFGRRKIFLVCLCTFLVFAHLTLLCTNIVMFMVFRFFMALGMTSVYVGSYVILSEIVGVEYRTTYCFAFKYGWTFAYMLMPYIAWLLPSWFWLQFVFTVPWLLLLSAFWIVKETPRWLLTKRRFDELEELLLYAAKKNGKNMNQAASEIKHYISYHSQIKHKENERTGTVVDLLRTPAIRKSTIIIYYSWFINSYIYYALSYNTNDLGGNPYLNFFYSGAVELPEGIIFMFLCRYIGNRRGVWLSHALSGICLIVMVCIPSDIVWLMIFVSMAGKFFSSACFDTVYVYTAEIFPTVVRNVAVGTSSTWARIGALTAPFVHQLAEVTYPWVPMAVPGAMTIVAGLLVLLLPETKDKTLPDTLEEGERFARKQYIDCRAEKCNGFSKEDETGQR